LKKYSDTLFFFKSSVIIF